MRYRIVAIDIEDSAYVRVASQREDSEKVIVCRFRIPYESFNVTEKWFIDSVEEGIRLIIRKEKLIGHLRKLEHKWRDIEIKEAEPKTSDEGS